MKGNSRSNQTSRMLNIIRMTFQVEMSVKFQSYTDFLRVTIGNPVFEVSFVQRMPSVFNSKFKQITRSTKLGFADT